MNEEDLPAMPMPACMMFMPVDDRPIGVKIHEAADDAQNASDMLREAANHIHNLEKQIKQKDANIRELNKLVKQLRKSCSTDSNTPSTS